MTDPEVPDSHFSSEEHPDGWLVFVVAGIAISLVGIVGGLWGAAFLGGVQMPQRYAFPYPRDGNTLHGVYAVILAVAVATFGVAVLIWGVRSPLDGHSSQVRLRLFQIWGVGILLTTIGFLLMTVAYLRDGETMLEVVTVVLFGVGILTMLVGIPLPIDEEAVAGISLSLFGVGFLLSGVTARVDEPRWTVILPSAVGVIVIGVGLAAILRAYRGGKLRPPERRRS